MDVEPRPPRRPPPDDHLVESRVIAEGPAIGRMLRRIATEIVERHGGATGFALVGIRTGGLVIAERLAALIGEIEGSVPAVPIGAVDIALYRDDVFLGLPRPEVGSTELPFKLAGLRIILVDDVLYTGRTVRAALDALMDFGRPKAVELAVLIDRGLRELPIRPDYVGLAIETTPEESVKAELMETAGADRVVIRTRNQGVA